MEGHALCKHLVVVPQDVQDVLASAWRRFWRGPEAVYLLGDMRTGHVAPRRATSAGVICLSGRRARRLLAV